MNCPVCKKDLSPGFFYKDNGVPILEFFKLCRNCREKGRIANAKRKKQKSLQAKEHYEKHKEEVRLRNKKYRENNKDKLQAYDKSPQRKAFHKEWLQSKRQEDPCRFIYYSAKSRSKADGIPFEILKEDICSLYPTDGKCPILGLELKPNVGKTQDTSPSLDRIIPEKGYIKGNIIVISHRANRIKNNATLEDLKKIVCFLETKEIR